MPSGSYWLLSKAHSDQALVAPADGDGRSTHSCLPAALLQSPSCHSLSVVQSVKLASLPLGGVWHETRVTARALQNCRRIGDSSGEAGFRCGTIMTISSRRAGSSLP